MKRPSRRTIYAYFWAAVGIAAATEIRYLLHPVLGEHLIFSMYYLGRFVGRLGRRLHAGIGHRAIEQHVGELFVHRAPGIVGDQKRGRLVRARVVCRR